MKHLLFLLPALVVISCSKNVDSGDLKDDVPYYQYYEVGYDHMNNSTVAAASFRVREKNGTKVELTNGASVRANNMVPGTSSIDKTRYTWTMTGTPAVNFVLAKSTNTTITNEIIQNDIGTIAYSTDFPATVKKSTGFSFTWTGDALSSAEALTVSVMNYGSVEVITKTITESPVLITAEELKDCPTGAITISLHRAKSIPVKSEDGNAGGIIQLRRSISAKATLQ
jgi:hypothetical protein